MNEQNNNSQTNMQSIPTTNLNQNISPNIGQQQPQNTNMNTVQDPIQNTVMYNPQGTQVLNPIPAANNQTIKPITTSSQTQNINKDIEQVPVTNNIEPPKSLEEQEEKGGCFKQILLFTFLIGLVAFVFFLPDISKFIQNGTGMKSEENLRTGTLVCTMEQEDDTSSISYEMKFNYIDNKLKTSSMTITLEDENDENINTRTQICQNMSQISQTLTGITVQCRPSDNLLITTEIYEHETIDKNNLTKFTEAGGTYPEFNYEDDINDVQAKMKKNGYICKDE